MQVTHSIPFEPHIVDLRKRDGIGSSLDPCGALSRLREQKRLVLLHSAGGKPRRFSLLGFDPVVVLGDSDAKAPLSFDELRSMVRVADPAGPVPGPFRGGFLGAISYDFGAHSLGVALPEDLRDEPFCQPKLVGGIYTDFLVWDHVEEGCCLVLNRSREGFRGREESVLAALSSSDSMRAAFESDSSFVRAVSSIEHQARVGEIRSAIKRGDLYQANLAHRISGQVQGHPVDVYRSLAKENSAPYMGYVSWPGGAILSASPELLIELERDASGQLRATTRPIKGTIQRGSTPEEDKELAMQLLASAKDRAELSMIVDLERNDLGRVAIPGGVQVGEVPRLETFAAVHHLVADVSAQLKPGEDAYSLLGSIFPGGSITGAPKLASMELIARLEGEERGFFCGALGFIDSCGEACFNILIRTVLWEGDSDRSRVSMRVGGGITWSSDAKLEDEETLHKAKSLLSALGVERLVQQLGHELG